MRSSIDGQPWIRAYGVHWVVLDEKGDAKRWGESPAFPVGVNHAAFTDSLRCYNQAIHKPVLDAKTGTEVEDPMIRRCFP
jgi:hypothetical protein